MRLRCAEHQLPVHLGHPFYDLKAASRRVNTPHPERGGLTPPEPGIGEREHEEPVLGGLLAAAERPVGEIDKLTNFQREPAFLGEGDPVVQQLDALECRAWAGFKQRIVAIAGEE